MVNKPLYCLCKSEDLPRYFYSEWAEQELPNSQDSGTQTGKSEVSSSSYKQGLLAVADLQKDRR
jgi:hypothetical protein